MDFLKKSFRSVCVVIFTLICMMNLFTSCQTLLPPEATVSPTSSQVTSASPSLTPDRSSYAIEQMRETQDPANYDVLREAKDYLNYDDENGTLFVYVWRIESFDFLSEFKNIKSLIIAECYIPEGVTIPRTDALKDIVEITVQDIYGSGAADVLRDCLPLPKLDMLNLSGEVTNKSVLPTVPSLTDLFVSMPGALKVISNNTQITGALRFGVPYLNLVYENIENIDGIEKFTSIQYLTLPHSVRDISPVAGCAKLRFLDASSSESVDSLKPLYNLEHLEEISISEKVYNALPEGDRAHFSPENNGDVHAVHVSIPVVSDYVSSADEQLTLSGQKIDSFDFLREFPNLQFLEIINCDIADELVLPKIDTLIDLRVYDPNALKLIMNNTQLSGRLIIGSGYGLYDEDAGKEPEPLSNLAGLEAFTSLENLTVSDPVKDISLLSGCVNLRRLSVVYCTSINTLKPLYELSRLRMLFMSNDAFLKLPQEDQERFSPGNNKKPYMTHIEWRD